MKTEEFIDSLYSKKRFGKKCGRDIMKIYTPIFGMPEKRMRIIHVAGTNGKGSTAAAIEEILRAAGYSTGLFTSPHLVVFNERIRFNGCNIPDQDISSIGDKLIKTDVYNESSMFDDTLMMALLYFEKMDPDYVILETGIGGRLDSTSGICQVPEVSVITRIGLDHTALLGDTISKIASEKAGIIKRGTVLVLGENISEASDVIKKEAQKSEVSIVLSENTPIDGYDLSLKGKYQSENMKNAVAVIKVLMDRDRELWDKRLRESGLKDRNRNNSTSETKEYGLEDFVENAIKCGIKNVNWPGRMQYLSKDPVFLIDGSHNPNGVEALRDSLLDMYPNEKFIFLTSVLSDKDHSEMYELIYSIADMFFTVTVDNVRAYSGKTLADELHSKGKEARFFENTSDAIRASMEEAKKRDEKVVAFGSLYFIGEILRCYKV
ncbi:MAG: bifunctional folylpolyglutamate synthase/dihydrofolate synthase [Lachnospiraceae bacterium]|jgi:dihydrofolate synthase/folylpolyglutamate synthase|nr:bifunctional folylpolyglutamate synthase/dihydrofolate synthase [Lachnospiraceae bacterium]